MYAVVKSGGQQFKVAEGDTFTVDHLDAKIGSTIELDQVVLVGGDDIKIGTPIVPGAKVIAEVVNHGLGDKKLTYRYRRTRSYRKIRGSRSHLTTLKVTGIQA